MQERQIAEGEGGRGGGGAKPYDGETAWSSIKQYNHSILSGCHALRRQSAMLFLQSSELGLPPPTQGERGCGGPNSDEGTDTVVL